ncbi:hypothetical protein Tco_0530039 [Tanacetum coccineum]
MFINLDQLEKQLDKEEFQETGSMDAFKVRQFHDILIQHIESVKKSIDERAMHTREYDNRVNERRMQSKEGKDDSSKTLDANLVVTESNETESERHVSSSRSGKDTHAKDADVNSVNDKQPMAEVQLFAEHNILANEQQHSEQSESVYDTYLLEKVDRNTIPKSTDMSHRGGEIDQNVDAKKCQTVENADLKAQIQEKVFANVALKNELRKLKGNSVDTKFAKPSILGKPVLQPPRNQSVVRQPNAFKSERPNFSKPRFASQVDVNNVLSKPVTQHYLPKGRESAFAKPNHMIASSSSRNSSKNMPRFSSNDMVHNHYPEETQKKTQEKGRNSESSVMHSTRLQNTTNDHKPKPRSNNQTTRNSKHFICSTCHKCVFNANHDACITKLLKEVNSRAKIQSYKTRNSNKPVDQKSHTQKLGRQIFTGHRSSPDKSFAVHERPITPRSCLWWKPMGRIFKTAGLRWIPTGNKITSSTTKLDSEPPNSSNEDITNPYEYEQTLNVSAGTLNLSAGTPFNPKKERLRVWLLKKLMSKNQVPQGIHKQEQSPNSAQGVKEQQQRAYFDDPCHELLHKVNISQGSSSNVHK